MGISSTLYSGYSKQEIETNRTLLKMASLHKFIESESIP